MDSPITAFVTTCNDGDSDMYFVGKDLGCRCAWAMYWATGQTNSSNQYRYEFFRPDDWVSVEDMDTTLLGYELADVEARNVPESAEATNQIANGTDETKRIFLTHARNNYPSAYWWVNPPPDKDIIFVDKNPTGWKPADYGGSNASVYHDKYKAMTKEGEISP